MEKEQIQVYANPDVKRRIEQAAAKYEIPVAEYCLSAILQQLADDELLDPEQVEITMHASTEQVNLLPKLNALHERILERRGGKPISVDIIEQIREERDYELTGLS